MGSLSRSVDVRAGAEAVLAVIRDVEAYPEWQREVEHVEVVDRDVAGRPRRVRVTIKAVGYRGWYVVDYAYPDERTVTFGLVESTMLTRHDARFEAVPRPSGGATFTTMMDLRLTWPLPGRVVDQLVRKSVGDMLQRVKARAEAAAG